jgi:zinc transporter ZupT
VVAPLLAALVIAAAHVGAGMLDRIQGTARRGWLSLAGGVAVAYVFAHLLPELAHLSETVTETFRLEEAIFGVALLGLVIFYGLERWARTSRDEARCEGREDCTPPRVFWIHLGTFGAYNAIVGYLLVHGRHRLWLFTTAMLLHFLVNDDALARHHHTRYQRVGRWALGAAVVLGTGAGLLLPDRPMVLALLLAFLSGGMILNTLKEEVPAERDSRYWHFAGGAVAYALLLFV